MAPRTAGRPLAAALLALAALADPARAQDAPFEEIALTPVRWEERIVESGAPQPRRGGLVAAYFAAPRDATLDAIRINGLPGDPALRKVQWCDLPKAEVRAGEIGIARCQATTAEFDPGRTVTIDVLSKGSVLWSGAAALPRPTLSPSYVAATAEGDAILVHVRNDADEPWRVAGLKLDGAAQAVSVSNAEIGPREVATIRLERPEGVPFGEWLAFTVLGETPDGAREAAVTRSLRLFRPYFPMGDWTENNGGAALPWSDEAELRRYLDLGIDLFFYTPTAAAPPELVLGDLAPRYDFQVYTHEGRIDPAFAAAWGNHPRYAANAVMGEAGLASIPGVMRDVRYSRETLGPSVRQWIYHGCLYNYQPFGTMADFTGMDHYAVLAPKCNDGNPPLAGGDRFELLGPHAEQAKYAGEPAPVWNWTQGLYENFNRCPTPEELRAQFWTIAGRGSRGLLWFQATRDLQDKCPADSRAELRRLADELRPLKPALLEGEWRPMGTVATSPDPMVDVSATVGPKGAVVTAVNFDYRIPRMTVYDGERLLGDFTDLVWGVLPPEKPFTLLTLKAVGEGAVLWTPRANVAVDFSPPGGFEPEDFFLVDRGALAPLPYARAESGNYRFTLAALEVAEAVYIAPRSMESAFQMLQAAVNGDPLRTVPGALARLFAEAGMAPPS